ncbi:LOW QUALITY PROTEIN: hypothetical protein PHMEG_00022840 [Phytophthora megakarya]|uniref:Eukaryotic/viral aspartic protease n=1 Tax=Phytophthora megakarya TaxID=4795 RepID=A0A225VJR9_9STRA|nr:LOW QUALITY PROTEIN: hypothetical protein PHMEG_00022840 [Phytophthora megakarya]
MWISTPLLAAADISSRPPGPRAQLNLQGRVYFTTDELEDVIKQVEEMEQCMRRKPANDVQFGRHKPQGVGPGATSRGGARGAYAAMATPEGPDTPALDPCDL